MTQSPIYFFLTDSNSHLGIRPFPFLIKFIRVFSKQKKTLNFLLSAHNFTLPVYFFCILQTLACCARGRVTLRPENPDAAEIVRPAASRATAVPLPFLYYDFFFRLLVTFTDGSNRVHLIHKMSLFFFKLGLNKKIAEFLLV